MLIIDNILQVLNHIFLNVMTVDIWKTDQITRAALLESNL